MFRIQNRMMIIVLIISLYKSILVSSSSSSIPYDDIITIVPFKSMINVNKYECNNEQIDKTLLIEAIPKCQKHYAKLWKLKLEQLYTECEQFCCFIKDMNTCESMLLYKCNYRLADENSNIYGHLFSKSCYHYMTNDTICQNILASSINVENSGPKKHITSVIVSAIGTASFIFSLICSACFVIKKFCSKKFLTYDYWVFKFFRHRHEKQQQKIIEKEEEEILKYIQSQKINIESSSSSSSMDSMDNNMNNIRSSNDSINSNQSTTFNNNLPNNDHHISEDNLFRKLRDAFEFISISIKNKNSSDNISDSGTSISSSGPELRSIFNQQKNFGEQIINMATATTPPSVTSPINQIFD